jgi:hypothetical protein
MINLKRIIKRDPIKFAVLPVPPKLSGGIFIYGRIGSGKTTGMRSLVQKYHDSPDRRYKVFDLWGGERNEQFYWTLPSIDKKYWANIKKRFKLENDGPKQYKVNLLYPMSKNLPNKLPEFAPYVKSKIFTIAINDLTIENVSLIIGVPSRENITCWRDLLLKIKNKENGIYLKHYAEKKGYTKYSIYRSFISPLVKEGILQSKNFDMNLDIAEEIKDRDTVSVLCLDFVDKELRLFYMGWIISQISKALDTGAARVQTIGMIPEASEFFRATDQAIVEDKYKIFRAFLAQQIRMGRRGFHLFLDAQSPNETKGLVDGSQDFTILGKLPSEGDREQATAQLKRDNLITQKQITDLAVLEPGEYYFCEVSKKAVKRYLFLPRTMYWREGYGNFYLNIWKKYRDSWMNTKDILDKAFGSYKNALTDIMVLNQVDEKIKREKELKRKQIEEDKEFEEKRRKAEREFEFKKELKESKKFGFEDSKRERKKNNQQRTDVDDVQSTSSDVDRITSVPPVGQVSSKTGDNTQKGDDLDIEW